MADFDYGAELEAGRRRAGLSVQQVSNAIRLRPDIIRALENSDFDKMPAKAFARNQVSAYARFLGLDPAELTLQFLKAYDEFESDTGTVGFVADRQVPSHSRAYDKDRRYFTALEEDKAKPGYRRDFQRRRANSRRLERDFFEDNYSLEDSGTRRQRTQRQSRTSRRNRTSGSTSSPYVPDRTISRSAGSRSSIGDNNIGSYGFRSARQNNSRRRLILIIAAIVIVILAVVLIGRCSGSQNDDAQANASTEEQTSNIVSVTGGSDSTSNVLSDATSDALEELISSSSDSGSFSLVVTVAEEQSSWVQIDVDGTTALDQDVDGSQTFTYTVTSTATISVDNPSGVTVSVNSIEVPFTSTEDGVGTLTLTLEDGQVVTS